MRTAEATELCDHLYLARDAILRAATKLSDEDFTSTETVTTRVESH